MNQETSTQQQARRKRKKVDPSNSEVKVVQPVEEEKSESNFLAEISLDVTQLPSRGVPYPAGTTLVYRTYSFGEVQKSSISNMSALQSIKMALAGITMTGMDKRSLTLFDLMYIGILRKVSSLREMKFTMPFRCRGCNATTEGNFTHKDIEFKDLDESVTELPVRAEVGGSVLAFSPMNVKDFLELYEGRYSKYVKKGEVDKVAVYAIMVRNMDFDKAYALLKGTVDPEDIEVLQEIDKLLLHDMKPLSAKCDEKDSDDDVCGTVNFLKLEGREALLRPFRDGSRSVRTKIRIGNKQLS